MGREGARSKRPSPAHAGRRKSARPFVYRPRDRVDRVFASSLRPFSWVQTCERTHPRPGQRRSLETRGEFPGRSLGNSARRCFVSCIERSGRPKNTQTQDDAYTIYKCGKINAVPGNPSHATIHNQRVHESMHDRCTRVRLTSPVTINLFLVINFKVSLFGQVLRG